jgi:CheY-like chemotaxis protein
VARILFVNDEADLVEISAALLSEVGHDVVPLTDGRLTVETAVREKPDLLVLDWIMNGITGDEVVRALRLEPATARLPILLISALPDATEVARLYALDGCLRKPFSADDLVRAVDERLATAAASHAPAPA